MSSIQDCFISFHNSFLLSSFLLLNLIVTPTFGGSNETDQLALLSFKSMITQDPYGVINSWNTSQHYCGWEGVTCNKRHQRVTVVSLHSRGLVGSLSPHVGNLSFLGVFDIFNNTFKGNIPHELGRLFRLQSLNLMSNNFDGLIPLNLSGCSSLVKLGLGGNKLVGKIPQEVSSLTKLTLLVLSENKLTGGIPRSIGNITSMVSFYVASNPLGGGIPEQLGQLKYLEELGLGRCNLSGVITPSTYNLSYLRIFSLAENQLHGSLPLSFGSKFPHLVNLELNDNKFSGPLPLSISNCSKLNLLNLDVNNFSGKIEIDFSNIRNLSQLVMAFNNLGSGEPDEMKFIDSMVNCTILQSLEFGYNELKGGLPDSIGNLSVQMTYLSLSSNLLRGELPSSLGNLLGIQTLELDNNQFIGTIPINLGKLLNLQRLALAGNNISGSIPVSFGDLSLLSELYLEANKLEGSVPSSLGNCKKLSILSLFQNDLTGIIPKNILNLSSLARLYMHSNKFNGSLSSEVGNLKNLNELFLSDNHLSGDIPSSLVLCISLETLNLARNSFQGTIPQELSSLKGLMNLDLSRNKLSRTIPKVLEKLSLAYLNLSFNELEGEVPVKGSFANSSLVSVFGNSKLCGGLPVLQLAKCTVKQPKKHERMVHLRIVLISTSCVLGVFIFSLYIMLTCYKKRKRGQASNLLLNHNFLQVSYNHLQRATNAFSEENLIGVGGFGSVYKGTLVEVEGMVAVKVLNLQNPAASKSFMAECEALKNIRHRNLLKIVTACSNIDFQGNDFKALVYEFMPRGSLENWLHSSLRRSLLEVMNVLIDVACALDYLHNDCHTPIVHCDIKPSNILFDDNMIAHVGDFGISRFLQENVEPNSSIGVKGTIGYAAPEYGLGGEITTSGDVYSFGILLLEIMTGKKPTDEMFDENLNLHKFVSLALPNNVVDIMDATLQNYGEEEVTTRYNMGNILHVKKLEESLVSIFNIGVACSLESPTNRMEIKNVHRELLHIRGVIQKIGTS